MSVPDRISEFLMRRGGQGFCDDCLRRSLRIRTVTPVRRAVEALRDNATYRRETLFCASCGNERLGMRAVGLSQFRQAAPRAI